MEYFQAGEWQGIDPFVKLKYKQLSKDVSSLAEVMPHFSKLKGDALFEAILHSCLWGNRVDLSNYTITVKAAHGDLAKREIDNIIINHSVQVLEYMKSGNKRVDFINDNVGCDSLYDLMLTD